MAAAPHFFACSQRTQLLASILHAPREAGGAGLSLAQLQRDKVISKALALTLTLTLTLTLALTLTLSLTKVISKAFPLHDHDERKALEERWGVETLTRTLTL